MAPQMTSPTSAARRTDSDTRRAPYTAGGRARGGFTLIELLVVIGIIVILMSILIPTVLRSQRQGAKAREAMDFQTIATGLAAYNQEFGSSPPVDLAAAGNPTPVTGAEVLVMALAAP